MFFLFTSYSRARKALTRHDIGPKLIRLSKCMHGIKIGSSGKGQSCELGNCFRAHRFSWNVVAACFSSWQSTNTNPGSHSFSEFCGPFVERDDFDENGGYDRLKAMGSEEPRGVCVEDKSRKHSIFDDLDEFEKSEKEGDEMSGEDDSGDEFTVINSSNGERVPYKNSMQVEQEEDGLKHPLVKEVCRLIDRRSNWTPKLEGELRHLLRSLKPWQLCAVLRAQDDERIALNFFYWADRQWRYRHDPIVYYTMLEMLSKTKLCQGAKRVLRLLLRRKIECRPEAFGYVMVSYSRAGNLRKAMQVLTVMQKVGVDPDLGICNTAIYVLVKWNMLEKALRFLDRMHRVGIVPNVVTYNCLIKGYCDLHRIEDALDLIAEMPHKGCAPDKVSYYILMGFLCKEKRIKEVKELIEKMMAESNLIPDQVTYNTLIHMLAKHGHGDEAVGIVGEAERKGFSIDKIGYSAIVHSFCQDGRIDRAKELINEMISKGCSPDVVTYTAVVNGFCRMGKVGHAKKLLQQMCKHGCKPNTVSYTSLLNGLCRTGNSSEAREMMNMSEEEWWTPNVVTYCVVMHGFRREGNLHEACDMVREMVSKGFFPTPVEINLLIQSLCQEGRVHDAKKFVEECLKKGCAVNVVNFTTMIHGFCKKDDVDAALSVLDDMYLIDKHPDVVTYTTVIDALGKKGRMEEAIALTKKMLHRGVVPTEVTYRAIIHQFCRQGRVDDLLNLLEKMLSRQPCRTTYNQVIEKLCSFGDLDQAFKLLVKVLRTSSRTDAKTCHMLMGSYLEKGIPLSSYKVACRMFNRNLIPDLKLCEKVSKRLLLEGKTDEADKLMLHFVERGKIFSQYQHVV